MLCCEILQSKVHIFYLHGHLRVLLLDDEVDILTGGAWNTERLEGDSSDQEHHEQVVKVTS